MATYSNERVAAIVVSVLYRMLTFNQPLKTEIMALTKSQGNMYPFVTHTWNAIKGICFHDCPYCYMKKIDSLLPIRFDPKELEVNLGEGNFIFVEITETEIIEIELMF